MQGLINLSCWLGEASRLIFCRDSEQDCVATTALKLVPANRSFSDLSKAQDADPTAVFWLVFSFFLLRSFEEVMAVCLCSTSALQNPHFTSHSLTKLLAIPRSLV
ncbi:hypothetical protein AXF42_Ash004745 [Apostasia shenzhenica]|uniref:Uncharacterized protein n=1 Tax=Apostasia shenzhenica TaxID=1088818 RepID=A0A2I0BHI8_9ASPA|nr:hypothetical protein AXF42_Ash004745 [Apostasia shenzhenica]